MYNFMPQKMLDAHFKEDFQILADLLQTWDGFEEYAPQVAALSENYLERIRKVYEKSETGYNVVGHGDHHPKNEMFLWDGGKVKDVCFVSVYFQT
jgi:hypothetical protein